MKSVNIFSFRRKKVNEFSVGASKRNFYASGMLYSLKTNSDFSLSASATNRFQNYKNYD